MARKNRKAPAKKTTILNKKQVGVSLTSNAVINIEKMAKETGLSRSKLIESLVTGAIAISSQNAEKTIAIKTDAEANSNINIIEGIAESQTAIAQTDKSEEAGSTKTDKESDSIIQELENIGVEILPA